MTEKTHRVPSLTVEHVSANHNVSVQAANHAVARTGPEAGILEEITGRSYNRVFQGARRVGHTLRPSPTPTR